MDLSVLIVDDDPAILRGFSRFLSSVGYRTAQAASLDEAKNRIAGERFGAVLLDLHLPDGSGIDWIAELREEHPHLAIIIVTGEGDIPTAVEAMRRGADNLLTKPVNMQELDVFMKKSLELGSLRKQERIRRRLKRKREHFWGASRPMEEVMKLAGLAAETESPVLLLGETGTGKGLLSRWIHQNSPVGHAEIVEVNCSSLRGELLASELFGHARGAFTTAVSNKQGLLDVASGGTLFLDEVGDMDLGVQAQFLKVIEEKRFRPLGEIKERRSDFRLICATNQDLEQKSAEGSFREDLLFRINVFPISVPPLRERMDDLPKLVDAILGEFDRPGAEITAGAMSLLEEYSWPGNLRELKNILERGLILSRGGPVEPSHLPTFQRVSRKAAAVPRRHEDLDESMRNNTMKALKDAGGDKKKAAGLLGISLATLYRRLKLITEDSRG